MRRLSVARATSREVEGQLDYLNAFAIPVPIGLITVDDSVGLIESLKTRGDEDNTLEHAVSGQPGHL